jgi:hypothetical protein
MSIVDVNGEPLAHGWNDEAASERWKRNPKLQLISDEEFEQRFPELFQPQLSRPTKGIAIT